MKIISSCLNQLKEKGLKSVPIEVPDEMLSERWAQTNLGKWSIKILE